MKRYMTLVEAEARAEQRIHEYEQRYGDLVEPPVPVERLIDMVYDLRILWEPISTEGGLCPTAALRPKDRQIVVNETRRDDFTEHPERLHFAYGHELGFDAFAY